MLDAHQLNVFLTASETLNFTQAARRLHMSQPSVSQHIHTLEKHFDTELFTRTGRSLQLTDEGVSLIPLARELVEQSILIEETMESLKGDVFGHLLVGCSTTPGKYVLPLLLASFHRQFPRVRVTCEVSSQNRAIQKLCEGEIHFALTSYKFDSCSEAEYRIFMREKVNLITPLDHHWAKQGEIELDQLFDTNFIHREEDSGTFMATRDALFELGVDMRQLQTLLTLGNSEAITLAVQEGLGVGFVSQTVIDKLGHGRVAQVKVKGLNISRDILIGHNSRRPETRAQGAFWDFILAQSLPIEGLDYFRQVLPANI